ncbi:hypothetical protein MKX01_008742 [Papaver californicum]|nr:hypothetical protein MKX01_008742 [Papaver californicum]
MLLLMLVMTVLCYGSLKVFPQILGGKVSCEGRQTLRDGFSTYSSDVDDDKTDTSGLVVSTCLHGTFLRSIASGSIAVDVGRHIGFQLSVLPMIFWPFLSARTESLEGMLLGMFLVGTGVGVGQSVVSLYVTERYLWELYPDSNMSWTYVISAYWNPAKEIVGWWRVCVCVYAIPAVIFGSYNGVLCEESSMAS